jgi:ribosome-associated protein
MRAQGAGGQNVNKVSSAIHLRFDIAASSLHDWLKEKLLGLRDSRITRQGVLILKAQQFRTQDANKKDAIKRLHDLVNKAAIVPAYRRATRPTRGSVKRRLESKTQRSRIKTLRGRVNKDSM